MQLNEVMNAIEKALDDEREEVSASVWASIEKRVQEALRMQADARPIAWLSPGPGEKFYVTDEALAKHYGYTRAVFDRPSVEASAPGLSDEDTLSVAAALESARVFIKNGVALGYIRMPDADCPDPAHGTLPLIEHAMRILTHASAATVAEPSEPAHPDDEAVDRFAVAMKEKLAQAREKGRGGWQECDPVELSIMLREHVEKGDPRDVANFCMFLWNLGKPISDAALPYGKRAAQQQAEPRKGLTPEQDAELDAAHLEAWQSMQQAEPGADERAAFEGDRWELIDRQLQSAVVEIDARSADPAWHELSKHRLTAWRSTMVAARSLLKQTIASAAQSGQRAGVAERVYPDDLSDALRHVLGFPNFKCSPFAHLMRDAGANIKRKAEDEQATVLHWLIKLVLDHGEKWAEVAQAEMKAMREKSAAAPTQQQEGGDA